MSDINRVIVTGRMGGDLELRYTSKGTAVGEVNVAVTSGFGENEKTNWIGCTFWGKSAEAASQYLGKGRKLVIEGRLEQDEWEDRETGKKRSKTRVVVENWTFADSNRSERTPLPVGDEDEIPL